MVIKLKDLDRGLSLLNLDVPLQSSSKKLSRFYDSDAKETSVCKLFRVFELSQDARDLKVLQVADVQQESGLGHVVDLFDVVEESLCQDLGVVVASQDERIKDIGHLIFVLGEELSKLLLSL